MNQAIIIEFLDIYQIDHFNNCRSTSQKPAGKIFCEKGPTQPQTLKGMNN